MDLLKAYSFYKKMDSADPSIILNEVELDLKEDFPGQLLLSE
jgi:hypothetical protein